MKGDHPQFLLIITSISSRRPEGVILMAQYPFMFILSPDAAGAYPQNYSLVLF